MSLAAPIRLGRLAVLALMFAMTSHAVMSLAAGLNAFVAISNSLAALTWRGGTAPLCPLWSGGPSVSQELAQAIDSAMWPYRVPWAGVVTGPILLMIVWGLVIPLPFSVLTESLARAKVRPVHVLRGWAYWLGLVALVGPAWVLQWLVASFIELQWGYLSASVALFWATTTLMVVLYVRWWHAFTERYLQLERPWLVTTLMLLTSAVLAITLLTWSASEAYHIFLNQLLASMM